VAIIRSGYSSRILLIKRVPSPEPVPPPREWVSWKPEGRREGGRGGREGGESSELRATTQGLKEKDG